MRLLGDGTLVMRKAFVFPTNLQFQAYMLAAMAVECVRQNDDAYPASRGRIRTISTRGGGGRRPERAPMQQGRQNRALSLAL